MTPQENERCSVGPQISDFPPSPHRSRVGTRHQPCVPDTWRFILGQEHLSEFTENGLVAISQTFSQRAPPLWRVVPLLAILTQTTRIQGVRIYGTWAQATGGLWVSERKTINLEIRILPELCFQDFFNSKLIFLQSTVTSGAGPCGGCRHGCSSCRLCRAALECAAAHPALMHPRALPPPHRPGVWATAAPASV